MTGQEQGQASGGSSLPLPAELLRAFDFETELARQEVMARDREQEHRQELERCLLDVAEVLDGFDRVLVPADPAGPPQHVPTGSVQLLRRQLESVLTRAGAQPFGDTGQTVAPERHEIAEVVAREPDGDPADVIVEVIRRGYEFRGKVLRAARVVATHNTERVEE